MSQEINNREYRKNVIKNLLRKLHDGQTVDDVKQEFDDAFSGVSASEISEAEQALISEGMPVSEVQRLCDVHSAVFKGSIEEIQAAEDNSQIPGHPAHTLKAENRAIEQLIAGRVRPALDAFLNDPKGINSNFPVNATPSSADFVQFLPSPVVTAVFTLYENLSLFSFR